MKYNPHLNLYDLLQDESFHAWAMGHESKWTTKWDQYFREHPEQLYEAEEARQMLHNLQFRKREVPEEISNEEFQKLIARIPKPVKLSLQAEGLKQKEHTPIYSMLAASVILVSIVFSAYFVYKAFMAPDHMKWQEVIIPEGSKTQLILPDNSKVLLSPGSDLRYPEQFGKLREVILSGEGYFDIKQDENSPFIVRTASLNIQVLGTRFNVRANPIDSVFEVFLKEGAITLAIPNRIGFLHPAIRLLPGQKAKYFRQSGEFTIERAKN
jgi:ferric-dicitrate binding protein FerR (iron transport regulator)